MSPFQDVLGKRNTKSEKKIQRLIHIIRKGYNRSSNLGQRLWSQEDFSVDCFSFEIRCQLVITLQFIFS